MVVADVDVTGTCELIGSSARFVRLDLRDDSAVTELMACQPQILVNHAGGGAVLDRAALPRLHKCVERSVIVPDQILVRNPLDLTTFPA